MTNIKNVIENKNTFYYLSDIFKKIIRGDLEMDLTLSVRNNNINDLYTNIRNIEYELENGYPVQVIFIDLSLYNNAKPQVMTSVTAFIEDLNHYYEHIKVAVKRPTNIKVFNYMVRMKFFKMNRFSATYPYNQLNPTGRFIELKSFDHSTQDDLNEEIAAFLNSTVMDHNMQRAIAFIFGEMIDNTCCHSRALYGGKICAQKFGNSFEISIVDRGIGIASSLRTSNDYNSLDVRTALEKSIEKGVSSKLGDETDRGHQGFGLYSVKELARLNGGQLTINSDEWCLETDASGTQIIQSSYWKGTSIRVILNFSDEYTWNKIWEKLDHEPYLDHLDNEEYNKNITDAVNSIFKG